MTKNPFINAIGALAYIVIVSLVMNYISHTHRNQPDTVLAPIAILSLVTLSAAVMGYFFVYQPLMLYLDKKKKEATTLFVRTILIFGGITAVLFTLFLTGILH